MKQIFDWLREQFDKQSINGISENGLVVTSFIHSKIAKLCIDEAEAKWEADCCELLDKLIAETPQYRHGVCAFRNEEECVDFEHCENCLVDAVKDIIKNSDSRFRKISEVE